MKYPNIFTVRNDIEQFGIWYTIHNYGLRRWWTIWCAYQMVKREQKATAEHAEWHYR